MRKRDTLYREIHRQISGAAAHDRSSERALSWAVNVLRFDDRGGTSFRLGRGGGFGGGRRILLCVPVYVLRARSPYATWMRDRPYFRKRDLFRGGVWAILIHIDNFSIAFNGISRSLGILIGGIRERKYYRSLYTTVVYALCGFTLLI